MESNKNTIKNFAQDEEIEPTPLFSGDNIKTLSHSEVKGVLRSHRILNFIKENPKTTAYQIAKKLSYNYTTVSKICRDMEYLRLICSYKIISEDNRVNKLLFVPKKTRELDGEDKNSPDASYSK